MPVIATVSTRPAASSSFAEVRKVGGGGPPVRFYDVVKKGSAIKDDVLCPVSADGDCANGIADLCAPLSVTEAAGLAGCSSFLFEADAYTSAPSLPAQQLEQVREREDEGFGNATAPLRLPPSTGAAEAADTATPAGCTASANAGTAAEPPRTVAATLRLHSSDVCAPPSIAFGGGGGGGCHAFGIADAIRRQPVATLVAPLPRSSASPPSSLAAAAAANLSAISVASSVPSSSASVSAAPRYANGRRLPPSVIVTTDVNGSVIVSTGAAAAAPSLATTAVASPAPLVYHDAGEQRPTPPSASASASPPSAAASSPALSAALPPLVSTVTTVRMERLGKRRAAFRMAQHQQIYRQQLALLCEGREGEVKGPADAAEPADASATAAAHEEYGHSHSRHNHSAVAAAQEGCGHSHFSSSHTNHAHDERAAAMPLPNYCTTTRTEPLPPIAATAGSTCDFAGEGGIAAAVQPQPQRRFAHNPYSVAGDATSRRVLLLVPIPVAFSPATQMAADVARRVAATAVLSPLPSTANTSAMSTASNANANPCTNNGHYYSYRGPHRYMDGPSSSLCYPSSQCEAPWGAEEAAEAAAQHCGDHHSAYVAADDDGGCCADNTNCLALLPPAVFCTSGGPSLLCLQPSVPQPSAVGDAMPSSAAAPDGRSGGVQYAVDFIAHPPTTAAVAAVPPSPQLGEDNAQRNEKEEGEDINAAFERRCSAVVGALRATFGGPTLNSATLRVLREAAAAASPADGKKGVSEEATRQQQGKRQVGANKKKSQQCNTKKRSAGAAAGQNSAVVRLLEAVPTPNYPVRHCVFSVSPTAGTAADAVAETAQTEGAVVMAGSLEEAGRSAEGSYELVAQYTSLAPHSQTEGLVAHPAVTGCTVYTYLLSPSSPSSSPTTSSPLSHLSPSSPSPSSSPSFVSNNNASLWGARVASCTPHQQAARLAARKATMLLLASTQEDEKKKKNETKEPKHGIATRKTFATSSPVSGCASAQPLAAAPPSVGSAAPTASPPLLPAKYSGGAALGVGGGPRSDAGGAVAVAAARPAHFIQNTTPHTETPTQPNCISANDSVAAIIALSPFVASASAANAPEVAGNAKMDGTTSATPKRHVAAAATAKGEKGQRKQQQQLDQKGSGRRVVITEIQPTTLAAPSAKYGCAPATPSPSAASSSAVQAGPKSSEVGIPTVTDAANTRRGEGGRRTKPLRILKRGVADVACAVPASPTAASPAATSTAFPSPSPPTSAARLGKGSSGAATGNVFTVSRASTCATPTCTSVVQPISASSAAPSVVVVTQRAAHGRQQHSADAVAAEAKNTTTSSSSPCVPSARRRSTSVASSAASTPVAAPAEGLGIDLATRRGSDLVGSPSLLSPSSPLDASLSILGGAGGAAGRFSPLAVGCPSSALGGVPMTMTMGVAMGAFNNCSAADTETPLDQQGTAECGALMADGAKQRHREAKAALRAAGASATPTTPNPSSSSSSAGAKGVRPSKEYAASISGAQSFSEGTPIAASPQPLRLVASASVSAVASPLSPFSTAAAATAASPPHCIFQQQRGALSFSPFPAGSATNSRAATPFTPITGSPDTATAPNRGSSVTAAGLRTVAVTIGGSGTNVVVPLSPLAGVTTQRLSLPTVGTTDSSGGTIVSVQATLPFFPNTNKITTGSQQRKGAAVHRISGGTAGGGILSAHLPRPALVAAPSASLIGVGGVHVAGRASCAGTTAAAAMAAFHIEYCDDYDSAESVGRQCGVSGAATAASRAARAALPPPPPPPQQCQLADSSSPFHTVAVVPPPPPPPQSTTAAAAADSSRSDSVPFARRPLSAVAAAAARRLNTYSRSRAVLAPHPLTASGRM